MIVDAAKVRPGNLVEMQSGARYLVQRVRQYRGSLPEFVGGVVAHLSDGGRIVLAGTVVIR